MLYLSTYIYFCWERTLQLFTESLNRNVPNFTFRSGHHAKSASQFATLTGNVASLRTWGAYRTAALGGICQVLEPKRFFALHWSVENVWKMVNVLQNDIFFLGQNALFLFCWMNLQEEWILDHFPYTKLHLLKWNLRSLHIIPNRKGFNSNSKYVRKYAYTYTMYVNVCICVYTSMLYKFHQFPWCFCSRSYTTFSCRLAISHLDPSSQHGHVVEMAGAQLDGPVPNGTTVAVGI